MQAKQNCLCDSEHMFNCPVDQDAQQQQRQQQQMNSVRSFRVILCTAKPGNRARSELSRPFSPGCPPPPTWTPTTRFWPGRSCTSRPRRASDFEEDSEMTSSETGNGAISRRDHREKTSEKMMIEKQDRKERETKTTLSKIALLSRKKPCYELLRSKRSPRKPSYGIRASKSENRTL